MSKILNYGSLNLDCVFEVPHIVRPGETIGSYSYKTFPGGKGANQSVAAARAGGAVSHAGKIGHDGGFWRDLLAAESIDTTSLLSAQQGESGRAMIQIDHASGENAIVLFPGANHKITLDEIDSVLRRFAPGDWLMIQNEINHTGELIRRGAASGMRVAFNPAPMTPDVTTFALELLALLVVNEHEASELSGESDPVAAAYALAKRSPDADVIVTLGKEGALCLSDGELIRQESMDVPEVVDTTGAGDTFVGAFVAMRAEGASVRQSLRYASASASLTVTRKGAIPSIPRRGEVEAFLSGK